MVTKDYASWVGHRFADAYSPEILMPVYESLLDLAAATERELGDMNPVDRIDIQSFIWVVGQNSAEDGTSVTTEVSGARTDTSKRVDWRRDMGGKEQLRQRFNRNFARWGIELPSGALSPGVVWFIVQRGWTIWTRFDIDDEDGRERLDYYAMHRMTNDRHVRMYADGEQEGLPAIWEFYGMPQGATAAGRKEARNKHIARNRAIEKMLEEKGFVMTDKAHPIARINRYLQTHSDEENGHH